MIQSFDYDHSYFPAMPVVEVAIWHAPTLPEVALTAIVDSGADITMVPVHYLQRIQARKSQRAWLHGTAATRRQIQLYIMSLRIGSYVQPNMRVVGDTQYDQMILGRDVLNHLIVTLNGLAGVVEISD